MSDQLDRIAAEGSNRALSSRGGWYSGGKPAHNFRCVDGYEFSAMAGEGNACIPRPSDFPESESVPTVPTTYEGPYTHVEVYLSENAPIPPGWDDYGDPDNDRMYRYVPVPAVRALIAAHGGLTNPPVKEYPMPDTFDPQEALEQAATFVATATGIRQQFIDQGWQPTAAEQMTVALFSSSKS